jgi:hypothetical protein
MAKELPYLPTYKNVGALFERIEKAKVPDAFTVKYLVDTIGLKGTGDRQLISLLKKLGFLDNSGKPTPEYSQLKNKGTAKSAIAAGIRKAYAPLYAANEDVHSLANEQLKGLVAQVSGAEEQMTKLISGTFNALVRNADFTKPPVNQADDDSADETEVEQTTTVSDAKPNGSSARAVSQMTSHYNPDFRFNIEVHLPSNGTEDTYLAIFNALRKALG